MLSYVKQLEERPVVIAVLNQKGGSGKTTISINLAHGLIKHGLKVMLADGDPQGSARDWHQENNGALMPVFGLDRMTLVKDLEAIKHNYHVAIIDGAPQLGSLAGVAIRAADIVLIPVQPSPYDVWATAELVGRVKERQEAFDGFPKAAFVLSRVIKNTHLSRDVNQALQEYELPTLNSSISQYVLYPTSAAKGETVFSNGENQAASEMNNLVQEVIAKYIERPEYAKG